MLVSVDSLTNGVFVFEHAGVVRCPAKCLHIDEGTPVNV